MSDDAMLVLLHEIAAGFRTSLPEAFAAFLLAVGVVAAFVLVYYRQERIADSERSALYAARYNDLLRVLDLPAGAASLLDRMALYLKEPAKRYLLLTSEASFNACLRRMRSEGALSPSMIASIRLRLGYRAASPEKIPLTSGDITEGTPILVASKNGGPRTRCPARVTAVEESFIELETRGPHAFQRGTAIVIVFFNFAGVYSWATRVIRVEGIRIRVEHTGVINSVQRRRYYRRKVSAAVFVRRSGGEEAYLKTRLVDLGGGGARIVNPRLVYDVGDALDLAFNPGGRRWVKVAGQVVRVAKDGSISVRFGRLRESTRDLILRGLFSSYISDSKRWNDRPVEITP